MVALTLLFSSTSQKVFTVNQHSLESYIAKNPIVVLRLHKPFHHDYPPEIIKHLEALSEKEEYKHVFFAEMNNRVNKKIARSLLVAHFPVILVFAGSLANSVQFTEDFSEASLTALIDRVAQKVPPKFDENAIEARKRSADYFGYGVYCPIEGSESNKFVLGAHAMLHQIPIFFAYGEDCQRAYLSPGELIYYANYGLSFELSKPSSVDEVMSLFKINIFSEENRYSKEAFDLARTLHLSAVIYFSNTRKRGIEEMILNTSNKLFVGFYYTKETTKDEHLLKKFGVKPLDENAQVFAVKFGKKDRLNRFLQPKVTQEMLGLFLNVFWSRILLRHKQSNNLAIFDEYAVKFPPELNDLDVETLLFKNTGKKVLLFFTKTCKFCDEAQEFFIELFNNHRIGDSNAHFGKINVNQVKMKEKVSVPSILIFEAEYSDHPKVFSWPFNSNQIINSINSGEKFDMNSDL